LFTAATTYAPVPLFVTVNVSFPATVGSGISLVVKAFISEFV
jgi:hypothetical protein